MKYLYRMMFLGLLVFAVFSLESIAHEWMAPEEAAKLANPLVQDEATVAWGKKLYRNNCAYCHGEALVGLTAKDTGLAKDAPNLKRSLKIHSEGDIFWKIQSGRGDMPAFRQTLSEKDIWAVITYIKSEIR